MTALHEMLGGYFGAEVGDAQIHTPNNEEDAHEGDKYGNGSSDAVAHR